MFKSLGSFRCIITRHLRRGHCGLYGFAALASLLAWAPAHASCPPLLGPTSSQGLVRLQDSSPQNLCQYSGRVLLVVNTASKCGFTRQYEGLEALHAKYESRGLTVLGFPSNDFGQQEPGSAKEIADFCRLTYGVKFPMFGKVSIASPNTQPFYEALIRTTGKRPQWNFHKYLIDRSGNRVLSFDS
ncbi:MAG: hypothetical protein RIR70_86, partial [Pseudomonadota bacterium]